MFVGGTGRVAAAWFTVFTVVGCGSSTEQAGPTTPVGAAAEVAENSESSEPTATIEWASLDFEAKADVMRQRVMPEIGTLFRNFDGEEFAQFTCATCHESNFQEVNFAMPNGLDPLNPTEVGTMAQSSDPHLARYAQFMGADVVPAMAGILGMAPYNPETQQGFGCFNCHAAEGP
jgi:hypothetical protein